MINADKVLTEPQLTKLLKVIRQAKDQSLVVLKATHKNSPEHQRSIIDYYLFTLLAYTGLRISEALTLKWDDIYDDFLIIHAENSKNKKKGTVYYGPKTKKLLSEFKEIKFKKLNHVNTPLVFGLNWKKPSRSYCHTRFKQWLYLSGLSPLLSIHSLRHTYGTICLDKGLSLTFVRDQLRHSNISITSQYVHLTKANRDKVKDLF